MKEVKAIIQPFRLEAVVHGLQAIHDLPAITVSTAHGVSVERGAYDQVKKMKIEIMVPDHLVAVVVDAIRTAAHTGNPGDGRVFVIPIEETVKIRSGERDTWK